MKSSNYFTGMRIRDMGIIASTWLRFAMRSGGGVVSLFLIVIVGLFLASTLFSGAERIIAEVPEAVVESLADNGLDDGQEITILEAKSRLIEDVVIKAFDDLVDFGSEARAEREIPFLTKERPAILSIVLLFVMYLIPFASCAAAFNQTASDIGSRGLRFLLSRTERVNIFVGRFLSATLFMAAALGFLFAVVTLYTFLRFPIYGGSDVALMGLEGWWVLFIFSLPFVALSSWISSTQQAPFPALALCYACAAVPWWLFKMVIAMANQVDVNMEWLRSVTPWDWRYGLISESGELRFESHAAMLAFTVVFLLLGLRNFTKRDL